METQYATLSQFAQEIERREAAKADFIVPSEKVAMIDDERFAIEDVGNFPLNSLAHGQVAERLGIPKAFYKTIEAIPGLRTENVNRIMHATPSRRLVRTLDGPARAYLSDRFRPIDNYNILSALLPAISDIGDVKVRAQALTEKKMYLQITNPRLEREVVVGDVVQAGVTISNSEVGCGAYDITSLVWRLKCSNGMILDSLLRKYHSGKRLETTDYDILSNETIKAELDALKLRMRDTIRHAFSEAVLEAQVAKLTQAVGDVIHRPIQVIENVTNRFGVLKEGHLEALIANMSSEGNLNRYGLANAVTYLAHSEKDHDQAFDFERLGSTIIDLKPSEWRVLSEVA